MQPAAKIVHIAGGGAVMFVIGIAALLVAPWRIGGSWRLSTRSNTRTTRVIRLSSRSTRSGRAAFSAKALQRASRKLFYLPYPYSDFIFSVVGEELGLVGTLAVVAGIRLAACGEGASGDDGPGQIRNLLGIGIVTGIVVQALFNISVVISILPAKGIPLPFISYGGSSVMVTLVCGRNFAEYFASRLAEPA